MTFSIGAERWIAVVVVAIAAPGAIALRELSDLDGAASISPLGWRLSQRAGGIATSAAGRLGAISALSPATTAPWAGRGTAARFVSNVKHVAPGLGTVYALKGELAKIHGRLMLDANIDARTWDEIAKAAHRASCNGFQSEVQQRLDALQELAHLDAGKVEGQRLSLEGWAREVREVEAELARLAEGYDSTSTAPAVAAGDEVPASEKGYVRKPPTIGPRSAEKWAILGREKLMALRTRVDEFNDFDHLSDAEWNDLAEAFADAAFSGRLVEALSEIKWLDKMVGDFETKTATYKESGITAYDLLMWTQQIGRNLHKLAEEPLGSQVAEPTHDGDSVLEMNMELWGATESELGGRRGAVARAMARVEQVLDEKIGALDSPGLMTVHSAFNPETKDPPL